MSLASIAWHIGATWLCKNSQAHHWLGKLRTYCSPCMFTFFHFPKKHMEHTKLRKILQTKGLKILCNIKIWWIFMLGNCCPIYKGLVYMCIKETHKRTSKMSPMHDLMNAIGIIIFNIGRHLMQNWHFFYHLVVF